MGCPIRQFRVSGSSKDGVPRRVCARAIERFVGGTFDAGHIRCGSFAAYLGDCDCEKENASDQKVAGVGEVAADELVWPVVTVPLLPALFEGGKKKTREGNTEGERNG